MVAPQGKLTQAEVDANQVVLLKLVFFSIAMALAPIGTYFSTRSFLFDGNATYSAIAAVVVANIVLVSYVTIAFKEDQRDQLKPGEAAKEKAKAGATGGLAAGKKTN